MIYLIFIGLLLITMLCAALCGMAKAGEKDGICKYGYKEDNNK